MGDWPLGVADVVAAFGKIMSFGSRSLETSLKVDFSNFRNLRRVLSPFAIRATRRGNPRRGNAILHAIRIAGFKNPILIEDGQTFAIRRSKWMTRLKAESLRLRQLAAERAAAIYQSDWQKDGAPRDSLRDCLVRNPSTEQSDNSDPVWAQIDSDELRELFQPSEGQCLPADLFDFE
jgi:hypothetical protein